MRTNGQTSTQQGLDVLKQDLYRTAPQFFNSNTERGRAATLIALAIAGGEVTGILSSVRNNPSQLYNYMGGTDNKMQGWAQMNTNYFNAKKDPNSRYYLTTNPKIYNERIGRILYGIDPVPTGRGRFNLDEFVNQLRNGNLKSHEDILRYLQDKLPIQNWQGLHGAGARRIMEHRLLSHAYEAAYGQNPSIVASSAGRPVTPAQPSSSAGRPVTPASSSPASTSSIANLNKQLPKSQPDQREQAQNREPKVSVFENIHGSLVPRGTFEFPEGDITAKTTLLNQLTETNLHEDVLADPDRYYVRVHENNRSNPPIMRLSDYLKLDLSSIPQPLQWLISSQPQQNDLASKRDIEISEPTA
jgi:hypothetical protein